MHWQDIVISVGQYVFVLALLPSIFGKDKPALLSSILTGTILLVFGAVYVTLALWSSAISSAVLTVAWFILAFQKYTQGRDDGGADGTIRL
ncbi:MAG: hypothetical protein PHD04_05220 [Candidatus Pacebacteria bacterium]|nr:hypothetical protein [Candidatus Paceibacterota bacterium]